MDVTLSDLANVTNLIGDSDGNGASDASEVINDPNDPKKGWYITFANVGEKVITSSITFNNVILFTSYTPPSATGSSCDAVAGTSKIYGMRVTDGNPYIDTNYDGQLTEVDRYAELSTSGIAPEPQIVLTDNGPVVCVGGLCGDAQVPIYPPPPPEGVMGVRWRRN